MASTGIVPEGCLPRIVDRQVERYLGIFGAVEIAGTKWCGKTWIALRHGASVSYVDDNASLAKADPTLRGGWILTGSSPPISRETKKDEALGHSGAGRIGRIRMHPMTLAESGDSSCAVSLSGLFDGNFEPSVAPNDTARLIEICCRGGWPEAVDMEAADAQTLAREYLRLFYTESAPRAGKDGEATSRLVGSLARSLG